jgi:hypothetical protein
MVPNSYQRHILIFIIILGLKGIEMLFFFVLNKLPINIVFKIFKI